MFKAIRAVVVVAAIVSVWTPANASAASVLATYSFNCITANSVSCQGAQALESQLFMDVITVDGASHQVDFRFRNVGPVQSSIADIYFDDGTLLGISSILDGVDGDGVDFSTGASPGNLPGANNATPNFETTAGFQADSDSPTQPNGVNPGESLIIRFNLIQGNTAASVVSALNAGLLLDSDSDDPTGTLRVGIHVQGLPNGQSDSMITGPGPGAGPGSGGSGGQQIVPEPTSLLLLGTGLGLVAVRSRRNRKATSTIA